MTQTTPATAVLGPGKTGLTIGYRVLNLDGTVYSAFSTTGVAETSTAGTYRVAGGVVAPLAGGYIVWGVVGTDYAEATVESASANVTYLAGSAVTSGVLPAAAAGASGGLPVLDANLAASANVTLWKGATAPAMTGDAYARLGAPAGASVSADIAAIAADVAAIDNSGTYSYSNTVDDGSGNLLDGVYIQLSTNSGFTNIVTTTHSNASGAFTVRSDTAGTHYLRLQLAGYSFTDQTVTLA